MKSTTIKNTKFILLGFGILLLFSQCQNQGKKDNAAHTEESSDALESADYSQTAQSLCESKWFPHSQTPAPEEGNGSPFDTNSTTNQIFHQWSWQKFLWLTKPENGNPLFESELEQVTNELIPITLPQMGADLVLTDIGQAGSNGILVSNAKYNGTSDTVYYSIHVNDGLSKLSDSMKNVILKDPNQLDNRLCYPVGALEVKISWVNAQTIPKSERKSYYQKLAYITTIKDTATMALLGMHVVGVVKNHPEFIWATFEHDNMAPDYDWSATTNADVSVTSNEEMLFFEKGYQATIKDIQYTSTTLSSPENIFTVFQYGIPRTAHDSMMPGLSQDDASNRSNLNHITSLNTCVKSNLGTSDIWSNYYYNGSVWLNMDGLSHKQQVDTVLSFGFSVGVPTTGNLARGSLAAFNITMETYAQCFGVQSISGMTAGQLTNCLSCHSAEANIKLDNKTLYKNKKSPLYFSHVFRSYLSKSAGLSIPEIEKLRIQEMLEQRKQ